MFHKLLPDNSMK